MGKVVKAIVIRKFGPAEELKVSEFTLPDVGPKQVLIKMKVAGVNEIEHKLQEGRFRPYLFPLPFVLGLDGSGVIEDTGKDVTRFKKGDRVFVFSPETGTYATHCVASENRTYHLHPKLSFEEGASFPIPYMTAYRALVQHAHLTKGKSVLIQGISGGVGLAAAQIAKALGASIIVGTAGTEKGMNAGLDHGAHIVRNYKTEGIEQQLQKDSNDNGFDIIQETNGDVNFAMDMELIKYKGYIIILGKHGQCQCNVGQLIAKETNVEGSSLFFSPLEDRQEMTDALYKLIEDGHIKPFVGNVYNSLQDGSSCHLNMAKRKGALGKNIILIS